MAYWDCPRCAAENSLDASCCWRCGFQNYGGAADGEPARQSVDGLEKQRAGLRDEMKKSLEAELERTRATLDRLAGAPPRPRRPPH